MLGIQADQLVAAELEELDGSFGGQLENNTDTAFAENVDLALTELGVFRSHGEKRLDRVVGKL